VFLQPQAAGLKRFVLPPVGSSVQSRSPGLAGQPSRREVTGAATARSLSI
jgi:hypothetical protein